jgi:hypothetical protein
MDGWNNGIVEDWGSSEDKQDNSTFHFSRVPFLQKRLK